MPEAGKPEGRLDLACKAIEAGNLVRAVALAQQSVDFEEPDVSESRWLLGRLLEEPDAFRLWNALRYLQLGSHRDAWLLVDRVHRKRMPNLQEGRDPQFDPEVMERELRTVLSTPMAGDLPPVSVLRRYFEVLDQYPFNEVLTHYWKALTPKLSQPGPERGEIVTRGRAPRRSRGREAGPSRGIPGPTAAAGEASPPPPPPPGAPPPPLRRSAPLDGVTYGRDVSPPAGVPAAAPAETLTTIRRTPHMDVAPEAEVEGLLAVLVYADQLAPRPGEDVDEFEVQIPAAESEIELEVWLVPSKHFQVVGVSVKPLRILRDAPRSDDARFQLAVRRNLEDFTGAFVSAYFHHRGRPCGRVKRTIAPAALEEAVPADRGDRPAATASSGPRQPVRSPEKVTTHPEGRDILAIDPAAGLPDILVEVVSQGTTFKTWVSSEPVPGSGYKKRVEEPWFLDRRAAEEIVAYYFEKFMKDEKKEERRDYLIGAGKELFLAAPTPFRELMLSLDPKKPPSSLLVCTEEPYIPWELMVPTSLGKPSLTWKLPIGAVIPTGRWVSTQYRPPVARVQLDASYLIAPTYPQPLDSSGEARILKQHFSCEQISPAALRDIDKRLGGAPRGLLHFACHGSSSPSAAQQLALDGGDLDPTLLYSQEGFSKAVEMSHPLVFLNACEVGRAKPGFVRTSGFAATFIALGAGAVIAPLWQVDDALAGRAAQDFYNAVAADPNLTFARAVSDIRRKSYEPGREKEDSFAAYTLYGDPLATRG